VLLPRLPSPLKNMLLPDVYWVRELPGVRLALMPRPRGGEYLADEIAGWSRLGVETVVSLLEPHEIRELDLAQEESLCLGFNLQFISFPIPDRGVPSNSANLLKLLTTLEAQLRSGHSVAVHCRAGIGRSGLIGACILNAFGVDPDSAFGILSRARGVTIPDTDAQVTWVRDYTRNRS
jgi:protein-tyrosine phosphatase